MKRTENCERSARYPTRLALQVEGCGHMERRWGTREQGRVARSRAGSQRRTGGSEGCEASVKGKGTHAVDKINSEIGWSEGISFGAGGMGCGSDVRDESLTVGPHGVEEVDEG